MSELYCLECWTHFFHLEWLQAYLKVSIDTNKLPLVWPIIECKAEIQINSVGDVLDKQYIDRFDRFSFKMAILKNSQKFLSCPTSDCDYIFCVEKQDRKGFFKCPSWNIEYWLEWEAPWHEGVNWKEYQSIYGKGVLDFEDQKAIDHALANNMKRWPKCKMWVYRIEGWDYMSCVQFFILVFSIQDFLINSFLIHVY